MSTVPESLDPSLWWDPFVSLLNELENAALTSGFPPRLEKKWKENCTWFVETVNLFKPPNDKSRNFLTSEKLVIGLHELYLKPELTVKALRLSSCLCLDEVQSYIIVSRSLERHETAIDPVTDDDLHLAMIYYYIERQCLLKCVRQILLQALYSSDINGNVIKDKAQKMISDRVENKLILILEDLLSTRHPEGMDSDLYTIWAEETLAEINLILDILFLTYYDIFCNLNGETWKILCSLYKGMLSGTYNLGSLEASTEAIKLSYHAKLKLLLILIEGLNLEILLQMVHDAMPYRQDSIFPIDVIQEIDSLVSSFNIFEMKGASLLILAWAAFLCLLSSLPGNEDNNVLMDIDHAGYAQQAVEGASFNYLLVILDSDLFNQCDGLVAGYRSVLRTFLSAFIASYDIDFQSENDTLEFILDVLCKIFRGQDLLCAQFWDKESIIDGPIRCLLYTLASEFPLKISPLVRLLSSLCEGSWPALCVHNFLHKSVTISTFFDISTQSLMDNTSLMVETQQNLSVPGFDYLFIPAKTRGRIHKFVSGNVALVRWETSQSGLAILLLRLSQASHLNYNEEAHILDLLSRMVSFNMYTALKLMDIDKFLNFDRTLGEGVLDKRHWVLDVICSVMKNLHPSPESASILSFAVLIVSRLLRCAPSYAASVTLRTDIFEMGVKSSALDTWFDAMRSSWMVSGNLAKILLIDSEENCSDHPLTISVLEFIIQLLETKMEDDYVQAFIVFVLQYICVNHDSWRYKLKHTRWRVTLKVLEVVKKCVLSIHFNGKFGSAIRHILLSNSSIHDIIFRLICVRKESLEKLYLSRHFDLMEIEGLHNAICSSLNVLYVMILTFYEDNSNSLPLFYQVLLSTTTKPVPVASAMISLVSYFPYFEIQCGAAQVLSKMFMVAEHLSSYTQGNTFIGLDNIKVTALRSCISMVLLEGLEFCENLFLAVLEMLGSAAQHQPAFLLALLYPEKGTLLSVDGDVDVHKPEPSPSSILDAIVQFLEKTDDLMASNTKALCLVFEFLRALWQGAGHYAQILEYLKRPGKIWKHISRCVTFFAKLKAPSQEECPENDAQDNAYKYQCLSAILEIIACEAFLLKKLAHAEMLVKHDSVNQSAGNSATKDKSKGDEMTRILSIWSDESVFRNIVALCATAGYDYHIHHRVKVAASLFVVLTMEKLIIHNSGSLSLSLIQSIQTTYDTMRSQNAFSELLEQYSQRGYSTGRQLTCLILNDLFYLIQGELDGRKICPGPFKELFQFLLETNCLQSYRIRNREGCVFVNGIFLYDLAQIRSDMGLDMWQHSDWREFDVIAQNMLDCMQRENSAVLVATSKLFALKSLTAVVATCGEESMKEKMNGSSLVISQLSSCVDHLCLCFRTALTSIDPVQDFSKEIIDFLTVELELMLLLLRIVHCQLPLSITLPILRMSVTGLKILLDPSVTKATETTRLLLSILLLTLESLKISNMKLNDIADVSAVCLGLLPLLCKCIAVNDLYMLSLAATNLIIGSLLEPASWFPVICKCLHWQHIVKKLEDQAPMPSIQTSLKFLLTLSRVNGGAEKLHDVGVFQSFRVLFDSITGDMGSLQPVGKDGFFRSTESEMHPQIWDLSFACITSLVHSLGDNFFSRDVLDNVVFYLLSQNKYLISYHLTLPEFPSDYHDKKRTRSQRIPLSLTVLSGMEQTLTFICAMSKHRSSWTMAVKEMNIPLREKIIHLLAFISRPSHHAGEFSKTIPFFRASDVNGELESYKKPSFVNSRNGWFAHSPCFCLPPARVTANGVHVTQAKSTESSATCPPTTFSDTVALQIYRIAFLLLKFLSVEAESAAKRFMDVGFVDLMHVPELPMPEILHGLQDQALAIVSELCNANKSLQNGSEVQSVCLLLIQILEMAIFLEFCVIQIFGIRPVLGRLEDFSKQAKSLCRAMEGHSCLTSSLTSLKQIISIVHPTPLNSEYSLGSSP